MSNKTTAADFAAFRASVNYWLERLGVAQGWFVTFKHGSENPDDNLATVLYNVESRNAMFTLYRDVAHGITRVPGLMARVGLHEALHLLLADLSDAASRRLNVSQLELESSEHEIIRRLESALLPTRAVGRSRRATRARPRGRA